MQAFPIINTTYIASLARQLRVEAQTLAQATQWVWWLLEKATGSSRAMLIMYPRQLTIAEKQLLDTWVQHICVQHKPIAYILGSIPFGALEFIVEPPILIPRAETEFWVDAIATEYQNNDYHPLHILDVGTGSGCIALLLAKTTGAHVTGIDINPQALALAQHNAQHNSVSNAHFLQSDLFSACSPEQRFDCILSNPPYIDPDNVKGLAHSVQAWEDHTALFSDNNGLTHIERIIREASTYLRCRCTYPLLPQKQLCIEINYDQADKIVQMLTHHGYTNVVIMQDQYQRDRVVCASRGCFCPEKNKQQSIL